MCEVTKCEVTKLSCNVEQSVNNDEQVLTEQVLTEQVLTEQVLGEQVLGEGIPFERIRRITGYLVGTVDRFNDAKKKEVEDRVKHSN